VYVLRCTRRLRSAVRRHLPDCTAPHRGTNRLGDWYANRLNIAQRRYIIAVNAQTFLTLVVPARDLAGLPDRLSDALDSLLCTLGVERSARARELKRMNDVCTAGAHDRSVVSSMNAIAQRAWDELYDLPHRPGRTLTHIDTLLAGLPLARLDQRTPADVAAALLTSPASPCARR
jgi:hypothetical protein